MMRAGKGASKGRTGGKGGARTVLTGDRTNGSIIEWKGNHGFIQPFYPTPNTVTMQRPRVFVSASDIEEEIDDENPIVSFVMYQDGNGFGAQEVRQVRYSGTPFTASALQVSHSGSGNAYVGAAPARSAPGGRGAPVAGKIQLTHQQLTDKVHDTLSLHLQEAAQEVVELEETWPVDELRKRVVRYLYKGSMADDLTKLNWKEAVKQFIAKATDGYTRSCEEKAWFTELNLSAALGAAAWCIAESCDGHPRPQEKEVAQMAFELHSLQLNKKKADSLMWEVVQVAFPAEEKTQIKLYNAMSKSYTPAFEGARPGNPQAKGFQRADKFLKDWMRDTLSRSWTGVWEASPEMWTEELITDLFRGLICPLDEESFSCIPAALMNGQERASEEWEEVLPVVVHDLFEEWAAPTAASKKRKKAAAEGDEDDI